MHARPHSAVRRSATASRIEVLESRIAPAAVAAINLSSLDGKTGFKINGEAASDESGRSVSGAGDVNGDGFADLIIGASTASPNGNYSGASYVVFGKAGGFTTPLELSTHDGANGFKINGEAFDDFSGASVSAAGDVNGDGFADLIIGADHADPNGNYSGASYVVFGKAGGFTTPLELSTLNGANGFKINGEAANDNSGRSVSAAGDVNGDGFADLIIGAKGAAPNGAFSGASYVVFGSSPIALSKDYKTATFTDSDGDIATVKVSKRRTLPARLHLQRRRQPRHARPARPARPRPGRRGRNPFRQVADGRPRRWSRGRGQDRRDRDRPREGERQRRARADPRGRQLREDRRREVAHRGLARLTQRRPRRRAPTAGSSARSARSP